MCFNKNSTVHTQSVDKYGRTIAVIFCDHINANQEQVKNGFAWVYTKYNTDPLLENMEAQARINKLGLWFDKDPTPPWVFRWKK